MTTPAAQPTSNTPTPAPAAPAEPKAAPAAPAAAAPAPTPKAEPKAAEPKKPEEGEVDLLSGDEPKGADGAPAEAGDIEITVPEGIEVDADLMGGFKGIAKELNIGSKGAQKLLDYYAGALQKGQQQVMQNWEQQKSQWRDTAKKDPEIGGANYKQNVELAKKAIDKLGGPNFVKALRDLDLGAHPEIIRFAYRVGKALSDDSMADLGGKPVADKDDPEGMLRAAFPSMYPKETQD